MTHYSNFGGKPPITTKITPYFIIISFCIGLSIGLFVAFYFHYNNNNDQQHQQQQQQLNQHQRHQENFEKSANFIDKQNDKLVGNLKRSDGDSNNIKKVFLNNSYSSVTFVDTSDNNIIEDGVYWGEKIENLLPLNYTDNSTTTTTTTTSTTTNWSNYINNNAIGIKMLNGCGRMQNRLIIFNDGIKGCVRYRQNIDQIQGELFSYYLGKILNLNNLAPSAISIVDLNKPIWKNLRNDIGKAQWNSNKPIVLTKFINGLQSAYIPNLFKPIERHLNRNDIINMTLNYQSINNNELMKNFVELAQWSDLIIFDYLTANLDRIVNNLYNYQWNINIMDAPAHNLAKKTDNNLLIFLDNESGLLHGYRLLKKYEIYHSLLLENLCLFRRNTANIIKNLKINGNVGHILREMFDKQNSDNVKDILPTLPDKSIKILNERIDKVYNQIIKCESMFSNRNT